MSGAELGSAMIMGSPRAAQNRKPLLSRMVASLSKVCSYRLCHLLRLAVPISLVHNATDVDRGATTCWLGISGWGSYISQVSQTM